MAIWHTDPDLAGRFHPEFPSDLQVLVHEGSFRFTQAKPEIMWARIHTKFVMDYASPMKAYAATLLNQPHQLKTLKAGQEILLVGCKNYSYTIRVTQEYLRTRADYDITPCKKCGLPEVFDPIPKLIEKSFPDLKNNPNVPQGAMALFTSFCPMCGGIIMLRHKELGADIPDYPSPQSPEPKQAPSKPTTTADKSESTGYSASKAEEPPVSEDFFKKLKKWFGKQ